MAGLPENSVDMIFADPPYFLSNNGITCKSGKMVSVNKGDWDSSRGFSENEKFHSKWIQSAGRILKPEGTIWISGTYHSIYQCGYLLQKQNFEIINDIAWFKPNASPNISCRYFTASHETIIWAKKGKATKHYFDYDLMKNGDYTNDKLKNPGKQMRSVWSIPPPRKSEKLFGKHPTQKPIDLLNRIVAASTKAGDVILDPFCGSGTTGVAVARTGNRRFIGIDTEAEYLQIALKRYKQLK
ncbi:MAG: site-specific DNA-methyltransferase [Ignavibacteriae bacterium]|nr:site-specific DNA-methyltransferase [Ignavibacteriota bacterium]